MTHKLDADDFFILRIQQHCAERGLSFFLVEPEWVEAFYDKLVHGKISSRVLLNMHSEHHQPDDVYHRLVKLASDLKMQMIDPPDVALAAFDKAGLHSRLSTAGFGLPHTVIVPHEKIAEFTLSDAELVKLSPPFVIKPSLGYGKRGVVLDAQGVTDLFRCVRAWPSPHYLLQRRIVPRTLGDSPAYFRLFHAFGSVWFCWWNCYTDRYRTLTESEMEKYELHRLREIICRLAELTKMRFFSTEVAQTEQGEFVLIDYVNDQCHMLTQSANPAIGVPDEIVAGIARRLVDGAQQLMSRSR